ncbi:MAG TPA: hypothetical protein VLS49_09400 [Usitatibacter sp.]|nr:hypothetical protein [Usitatibacter sp.]
MAKFDEALVTEQEAYAVWLAWGTRIGFIALVVTYFLYVAGIVAPSIPMERLPALWGLSLGDYLAATHAPTGWTWLGRVTQGDFLNLVGVAILAASTLACYFRVLPIFARSKERAFVAICVVEIVVLLAAAAGVF